MDATLVLLNLQLSLNDSFQKYFDIIGVGVLGYFDRVTLGDRTSDILFGKVKLVYASGLVTKVRSAADDIIAST